MPTPAIGRSLNASSVTLTRRDLPLVTIDARGKQAGLLEILLNPLQDLGRFEPRVARLLVKSDVEPRYKIGLEVLKSLPYDRWRQADPEDTLRFWGPLHPGEHTVEALRGLG